MTEQEILIRLDQAIRAPRATASLDNFGSEVESFLGSATNPRLAWKPIPLDIYDDLPPGILSSWVFALRANSSSGAERHPNCIQRVMSYRGSADMRTWENGAWRSNQLVADPTGPLERRWLSIPVNVWHRPVMDQANWVVVSFHTATAEGLIEELASDDEHPDRGPARSEVYSGRQAR